MKQIRRLWIIQMMGEGIVIHHHQPATDALRSDWS